MDSGLTTYNDVMRNFNSTINNLMRPIKRKKIIKNVLIKAKEVRIGAKILRSISSLAISEANRLSAPARS